MRLFILSIFAFILSIMGATLKLDSFQQRTWNEEKPVLAPLQHEQERPVIPLAFPARTEVVSTAIDTATWREATHLLFTFKADTLPKETILTIFTKDNDNLWRQVRMPCPVPKEGLIQARVPIVGPEAVALWQACGHNRPWTSLTAANLLEYGCIFDLDTGVTTAFQGKILLQSIETEKGTVAKRATPVRDFSYRPASPAVGSTLELSFRLDAWPTAPFDSARTKITATIATPDGKTETVHGFYYEGFLYDEQEWDKTQCLTPNGEPLFKVRYCPRVPGKHSISVLCEIDDQAFPIQPFDVEVSPAPDGYHGFVRRDAANNQFFAYDDGAPFWGLGMNVRSPFDNRYKQVAPYSTWEDMGLATYDLLMKKYKAVGINVMEVWMCSWWLALEWINDAPGFHGVGHYNQYRAWMLDHIMELARQNDIYIILVFNNHGKFAMHYDTEWKRNPFNKINGGYLTNCEEYYTNERARSDTKKLINYVSARWGATPNLLAWKLFTEVDLTGPDLNFYTNPVVTAWHQEMGDYFKKIDLYQHLVTTHWMLGWHRINKSLAIIPQLDFISTDAYYSLGEGTGGLVSLLNASLTFAKGCAKPLVITEFGGSSYADSMTNLMKQVPIGIWTGFFNEMGIIPMYWWFALLEDKKLYSDYIALSQYGATEDRRKMTLAVADLPNAAFLSHRSLRSDTRLLGWLYDKDYYFSSTENIRPAPRKGIKLELAAPKPGDYTVEIWDSVHGNRLSATPITIQEKQEKLTIDLPDFQMHIAYKVIK